MMNFVVAALLSVFFSLSQVLCACSGVTSATNNMAAVHSVHSHQTHADGHETPCNDGADHCELQTATVTQADKAAKQVQPASGDTKLVARATPPSQRAAAAVVSASMPLPAPRSYPLRQTPIMLKVRFLS